MANHPFCCFCGGQTPSAEPDHIPSRVIFYKRRWPEGYEFPSCTACNRISRHDEQVVAMLSRLYPGPDTADKAREANERIRAVAYYYPEILDEMKARPEQVESTLEKYKLQKPDGVALSDLPFLSVSGPLINNAVANFGRKLFLALHYKYTNRILPKEGGIAIRWYSNLQVEHDEIPRELTQFVTGFPNLERSKTDLSDQFFYRFGITDDLKASLFLAFFGGSFAILGYVNAKGVDVDFHEGATILQPYEHE